MDAQENPLPLIDTSKFYEVQKYVSMTSHMWDGFWVLGNRAFVQKLPAATREIIAKRFREAALAGREDIVKLNANIVEKLKAAGMTFVTPDRQAFRAALSATPFYGDWKQKFGEKAWSTLEAYTGKLG